MILDDRVVFESLQFLEQMTASGKPLLFWIGSGMSAWCGYPLWKELATQFHAEYIATEPSYDRFTGERLLAAGSYPAFFSKIKSTAQGRFFAGLKVAFQGRPPSAEYLRFLTSLQQFTPLRIITTNVDESLEQNLPDAITVQQVDLSYVNTLNHNSSSFIAKLHGTISEVQSTVFTAEDYDRLIANGAYMNTLQRLFSTLSVIVIGSSLTDDYLLSLLQKTAADQELFGDGPHFLISSDTPPNQPISFRVIRYDSQSSIGHRTAIQILESVAPDRSTERLPSERTSPTSAYFLIDLFPPNFYWTSGVTTSLGTGESSEISRMVRGLGFSGDEIPANSTTLHDVLVALTCFEKIYAPLDTVPKFAFLLGGDLFRQLIEERALEFIWWDAEEAISFLDDSVATGGISSFVLEHPSARPITLEEKLGAIMQSSGILPTQQWEFTRIVATATTRMREAANSPIFATIENALRLPRVRRLIGFSRFTSYGVIPRWLAHPVLRSAKLTRAAETCRFLRAASIKFPFGARLLARAILAVPSGPESADNIANYVLYGSFKPSVPLTQEAFRRAVAGLLRFRLSNAADRQRSTILQYLATDEGAECAAAIDATLKSAIPTAGMQEARDQFSEFLMPDQLPTKALPALWTEANGGQTGLWRARSRKFLLNYCAENEIPMIASCPCGSTIAVKDCCLESLTS